MNDIKERIEMLDKEIAEREKKKSEFEVRIKIYHMRVGGKEKGRKGGGRKMINE